VSRRWTKDGGGRDSSELENPQKSANRRQRKILADNLPSCCTFRCLVDGAVLARNVTQPKLTRIRLTPYLMAAVSAHMKIRGMTIDDSWTGAPVRESSNSSHNWDPLRDLVNSKTGLHVHMSVSMLVESGNVLCSTSIFGRYSNTSNRSTNMEVKFDGDVKTFDINNVRQVGRCHLNFRVG